MCGRKADAAICANTLKSSFLIMSSKGLCNSYQTIIIRKWAGGGLKDEPHKEKYYVMPPANEGNFSSGPSPDLAKNHDQPALPYGGDTLSLLVIS